MIDQFISWWGRQLLTLLPDQVRGHGFGAARAIVITHLPALPDGPDVVEVSLPSKPPERLMLDEDGTARLRTLRARAPRAPVLLRLRPGTLLERDVVLPLAVERSLDRVLQYEMNRLTPFAATETIWGWTVTRRERAQAQLHLRLTLGARGSLAAILAGLAAAGSSPAVLEAAPRAGGERWRRIDLSGRSDTRAATRPMLRAGLAACCLLFCALIVTPFVKQSLAMMTVETRIAALGPQVAEASRLRYGMAARSASGRVFAAARDQFGDPLRAIAAVTDALPDDSWLTDFVLQQRQLRIDGRSRAAVQLIARLAANPATLDPAFAAPVTRDDGGRTDIFSISAVLAP